MHLVKTWLLADRLLLPAVQNLVMLELCTKLQSNFIDADTIVVIHNNTVAGSMLRTLACYEVALTTLRRAGSEEPAAFSKCFDELKGFAVEVLESARDLNRRFKGTEPQYRDVFVASSFQVPEK